MNRVVERASVPPEDVQEDETKVKTKEPSVPKSVVSKPLSKKGSQSRSPPKEETTSMDHSLPRNPRVAEKEDQDEEEVVSPSMRRKNTLKTILRPELEMLERTTPPRHLEAFRSQVGQGGRTRSRHGLPSLVRGNSLPLIYPDQVRIGEEILAIPQEQAKELFSQSVVSGPWLQEDEVEEEPRQKYVPKYPRSRDHRCSVFLKPKSIPTIHPSTEHIGQSGVYQRPASQGSPQVKDDIKTPYI